MTAVFKGLFLLIVPVALAQQPASPPAKPGSPFLSVPTVGIAGSAEQALRFGVKLPDFQATDTSGRIWRLADLRGKFTLIYVWSMVEARLQESLRHPGVAGFLELPAVQRCHEQVKDPKNIQVLTFCRDDYRGDYMPAEEYMKMKQYTFPVVADYASVVRLFDGIKPWVWKEPAGSHEWIVNPEGQLAYPVRSWSFGRLLFEVEKAARN
jgi:hypothetical protein